MPAVPVRQETGAAVLRHRGNRRVEKRFTSEASLPRHCIWSLNAEDNVRYQPGKCSGLSKHVPSGAAPAIQGRQAAPYRMQVSSLRFPALLHHLVGRAVPALVGDFPHPLPAAACSGPRRRAARVRTGEAGSYTHLLHPDSSLPLVCAGTTGTAAG